MQSTNHDQTSRDGGVALALLLFGAILFLVCLIGTAVSAGLARQATFAHARAGLHGPSKWQTTMQTPLTLAESHVRMVAAEYQPTDGGYTFWQKRLNNFATPDKGLYACTVTACRLWTGF